MIGHIVRRLVASLIPACIYSLRAKGKNRIVKVSIKYWDNGINKEEDWPCNISRSTWRSYVRAFNNLPRVCKPPGAASRATYHTGTMADLRKHREFLEGLRLECGASLE